MLRGQIALEHLEDYVTTKQIITSLKDTLEDSGSVTSVHGRYYQLAAQYYRYIQNILALKIIALQYYSSFNVYYIN